MACWKAVVDATVCIVALPSATNEGLSWGKDVHDGDVGQADDGKLSGGRCHLGQLSSDLYCCVQPRPVQAANTCWKLATQCKSHCSSPCPSGTPCSLITYY